MTALLRYDAARTALAEAVRVDEVVELHLPAAAAMKAYAIQAKDPAMIADAIDYRERAERKLGELLLAQKAQHGLARGGRPAKPVPGKEQVSAPEITLADMKIDRKLSSRAQRKAGIAERAYEMMLTRQRERIMSRGVVDLLKDVSTEAKRERRDNRERVLGACQLALPDKRYGLILADPEWRFEPRSRDTGMDRAPDNHYATSETSDICKRPVQDIAAPDCVLALWATAPMLPDALQVMAAWGFAYKTHCIWHKLRPGNGRGPGYWFTGEHELLLIGSRGKVPAPATALCGSVLAFPVGPHSAKPEQFAALLEAAFPTLPKIELNRRGPARPGWDAWGAEAQSDSATGEAA